MTIHLPSGRVLAALILSFAAGGQAMAASPPTPAQALRLKPMQKDVEYDTPAANEIEKCTIKPEKIAGKGGWVVKSGAGQLLRSFVDNNADNTVDQWSYYKDGVEVYRDIDTNHNGTADQSRWLNTAGTRWGIDKNEDKTIDVWQVISPEEVSAEVVAALRDGDAARFDRLLLTSAELSGLGFGRAKFEELEKRIAAAPAAFLEYRKNQKIVGPGTTWAYFGGSRPGLVPLGTDDSTADITVYDNVAALTETDGKSGQVPIGTLIKVGDVWRLIDAPGEGGDRNLTGTTVAQEPEEWRGRCGRTERQDAGADGRVRSARQKAGRLGGRQRTPGRDHRALGRRGQNARRSGPVAAARGRRHQRGGASRQVSGRHRTADGHA